MNLNPKRRAGQLTSVGRVGTEIGKIYRVALRGQIETVEAYRLTQVLLGVKACLETSAFEERLAEMETAIAQRGNVEHLRPKVAA